MADSVDADQQPRRHRWWENLEMGAHPYWYFVDYQEDVSKALDELREREFQAGRYNPVQRFPDFSAGPDGPAPGPQHDSIEEALQDLPPAAA